MSTLTTSKRLHHTSIGLHYLREAYTAFRDAGAIHTAARIRACLKSAEGAVRHAERLDVLGEEDLARMKRIRVHRRNPRPQGTPHYDHFQRTIDRTREEP